jgi:hypothetical protein
MSYAVLNGVQGANFRAGFALIVRLFPAIENAFFIGLFE